MRAMNQIPNTYTHRLLVWVVALGLVCPGAVQATPGVTSDTIRIGGVMDLEGRSQGLGQGMKKGIETALDGQRINGKRIEFITLDDSYTPTKTERSTRTMLEQEVFAMLGNVGTPTAKVSLPILAEKNVPAVGFFTAAVSCT